MPLFMASRDYPMNEQAYDGGCQCGTVRYRISGAPRSSTICFCRSCRLSSGAPAVGWLVVPVDRFQWLAGQPKRYRSSTRVTRGFCIDCGTLLTYQHDDSPGTIDLTTVTVDRAEAVAPTQEIWLSDKVAWAASDPRLRHWPRDVEDP
jgi:hypothetical protein